MCTHRLVGFVRARDGERPHKDGEPEEGECSARAEEGEWRAAVEPARRLAIGRTPRHRMQAEEEVVGAALAGDGRQADAARLVARQAGVRAEFEPRWSQWPLWKSFYVVASTLCTRIVCGQRREVL